MKKPKKITEKVVDALWAEIVKLKAGGICEIEGCEKISYLNSHHVYSRSNRRIRWDFDNGICLCSGHHTLSSSFSAHKTPMEFTAWIINYRGKEWEERLKIKARPTPLGQQKIDRKEVYEKLKKVRLKYYSDKIKELQSPQSQRITIAL